jgi:hypothetical protein
VNGFGGVDERWSRLKWLVTRARGCSHAQDAMGIARDVWGDDLALARGEPGCGVGF